MHLNPSGDVRCGRRTPCDTGFTAAGEGIGRVNDRQGARAISQTNRTNTLSEIGETAEHAWRARFLTHGGSPA